MLLTGGNLDVETRLTRRAWLAAACGATACSAAPENRFGVNLYTVREPLATEPERVLRALGEIGCSYLEARLSQVEDRLPLLDELGMPWVNWMIETPLVTGAWDVWDAVMQRSGGTQPRTTLAETMETAVRHNVRNLGISFTLPAEREGPDGWKLLADKLNRAGEAAKDAGLQFYFHNHAEEFVGPPGERPFDQLLAALDPELVRFEIDVFWVSIAGADPAAAIRQAGDRTLSLHLKDKAEGTANVTTTMGAPLEATSEVGSGALDWQTILSAAREANVEWLLIEQDRTPGDPLDSVRRSFDYLKRLV